MTPNPVGRPPLGDKKRIFFPIKLPPALIAELDKLPKGKRTAFVEAAIKEHLKLCAPPTDLERLYNQLNPLPPVFNRSKLTPSVKKVKNAIR